MCSTSRYSKYRFQAHRTHRPPSEPTITSCIQTQRMAFADAQAPYFEQKFYATFFLAPLEAEGHAGPLTQAIPQAARLQRPAHHKLDAPRGAAAAARSPLRPTSAGNASRPGSQEKAHDRHSNTAGPRQHSSAAPATQRAAAQYGSDARLPDVRNAVSSLGGCLSDAGLSDDDEVSISAAPEPPPASAQHLAAAQKLRVLEAQLEAAAAREALLRDGVAARDDTIRCGDAMRNLANPSEIAPAPATQ